MESSSDLQGVWRGFAGAGNCGGAGRHVAPGCGGAVRGGGDHGVTTANLWVRVWFDEGREAVRPKGGDRHSYRIEAHRDPILSAIAAKPDITLAELAAMLKQEHGDAADGLLRDLRQRAGQMEEAHHDPETATQRRVVELGLRLTAVEAARTKLLMDRRDELDADAFAALVAELDLEEEQIRVSLGER